MSDFFDEAMEDMSTKVVKDEGETGAEEWTPQNAGEALQCVFIKAKRKNTKYGPGFNVLVKDVISEEYIKIWAQRSMLKSQLLDASPAIGSPMVLVYNGQKDGANGYPFHSYQVRAEKSDVELWKKYVTEPIDDAKPAKPEVVEYGPDEVPY